MSISVKECVNMSSVTRVSPPNFVQKFGGKFMAHIGEVLEKGLKLSGTSITKAADLMDVSRQTIYAWIETPNLDQARLALLGKKIGFDYLSLLGDYADQDVFNYVNLKPESATVNEPQTEYVNTNEPFKIMVEIDHENLAKLPKDFSKRLNELLKKGKL